MKKLIISIPLLFLLYGCGSSEVIEYPELSSSAKNGSFISRKGIYEYGDKEYAADYGTIAVPENRKNPHSKLIHLPVMRIHARSVNVKEPVFCLSGGPGQSNMYFPLFDSLLYDHDFVRVGYRGVDGSSVLRCPEVDEAVANSQGNLLSEETLKNIAKAWDSSFVRFRSVGIDINGYTIPETVEDMETVRRAFNYKKINLASGSYGTRVAYIYGLMYPDFIHRSVMVGVNPPGGFIWDPQRTDNMIKYYSRLWAKDSVMSERCADLAAAMEKVLKNMPRKWLFFSIDPGRVRMATFAMLFHRNTAALVFDAYVAAEDGDNSGLALMSMAFDYMMPEMIWGDQAAKAVSADLDYWNSYYSGKENQNIILGAPMTEFAWKPLEYGKLDLEMIPESLRVPQVSDVETLMLSGSVDVTNPPECAAALLPYLKNGKQVIMSEAGHVGDLLYLQKNGSDILITNFINAGVVDTSQIKYVPMNFDVGWGLPGIAKAGLCAAAGVVLLVAGVIVWIF
ncbi:MAG TPA: alpha/beta hydrolase [Ignavibacteriaceae bacterium]|nr:alpha/beta hydrolase [Ignavibacteriaceae bacterium]